MTKEFVKFVSLVAMYLPGDQHILTHTVKVTKKLRRTTAHKNLMTFIIRHTYPKLKA